MMEHQQRDRKRQRKERPGNLFQVPPLQLDVAVTVIKEYLRKDTVSKDDKAALIRRLDLLKPMYPFSRGIGNTERPVPNEDPLIVRRIHVVSDTRLLLIKPLPFLQKYMEDTMLITLEVDKQLYCGLKRWRERTDTSYHYVAGHRISELLVDLVDTCLEAMDLHKAWSPHINYVPSDCIRLHRVLRMPESIPRLDDDPTVERPSQESPTEDTFFQDAQGKLLIADRQQLLQHTAYIVSLPLAVPVYQEM
jgi:hypothetical protein